MEDFLEKNIEDYHFEKELFSKDMNRLWKYFYRNNKGLRDTYIFLRIIHQEKNGNDFDSFFKSNVNEIVYRSLLCEDQVKKYVNVLIALGLVERNHEKKKSEKEDKEFKSESFYKVKKITNEVIHEMQIRKMDAVILLVKKKYKFDREEKI